MCLLLLSCSALLANDELLLCNFNDIVDYIESESFILMVQESNSIVALSHAGVLSVDCCDRF